MQSPKTAVSRGQALATAVLAAPGREDHVRDDGDPDHEDEGAGSGATEPVAHEATITREPAGAAAAALTPGGEDPERNGPSPPPGGRQAAGTSASRPSCFDHHSDSRR